MADAWVVYGSTGEYSDHQEWMVCAYVGKDAETKATRHADRAAERVKQREKAECEHGIPLAEWCGECSDLESNPRTSDAFRVWMGDLDPNGGNYGTTTADFCALRVPIRSRVPAVCKETTR